MKEVANRYAELIQPNMEDFREEMRGRAGEVYNTTPLLADAQRETLALACFLKNQIESVKAINFPGPALLLTGTLEEVVRHTIYEKTSLRNAPDRDKTLGGVIYFRHDLQLELERKGLWQEQITTRQRCKLNHWFDDLKVVKEIRNKVAHQAYLSKQDFMILLETFFSSPGQGPGVFDGLLLAWTG